MFVSVAHSALLNAGPSEPTTTPDARLRWSWHSSTVPQSRLSAARTCFPTHRQRGSRAGCRVGIEGRSRGFRTGLREVSPARAPPFPALLVRGRVSMHWRAKWVQWLRGHAECFATVGHAVVRPPGASVMLYRSAQQVGLPPTRYCVPRSSLLGRTRLQADRAWLSLMWHASLPSLVSRSWTSCRGDGHTARVIGQEEGAGREVQREGLEGWPRSDGAARDPVSGAGFTAGGIPPDSRRPGEHSPI